MLALLNSYRRWSSAGRLRTASLVRPRRQWLQVEELEARDNPSPIPSIQNGVLLLVGDNANNTYTLDHSRQTTFLDGYQFADSAYSSVQIDTGTGQDNVNIEATLSGKPLTINCMAQGYNVDGVDFTPTSQNLTNIAGPVTVNNINSAFDFLVTDDQHDPANDAYTITANTVSRTNMATITYDPSNTQLILHGGFGNVTYNVNSTSANDDYEIFETGSGNDTANFAPESQNLDNIHTPVKLSGNNGVDTVVGFDQNDSSNDTYTITSGYIGRPNTAGIYCYGPSNIHFVLNGGSGDVTYDVVNTDAAATYTINETGVGNDTVNFAPTSQNLGNIAGAVAVNGNSGYDVINLDDQNYGGSGTYTITNSAVTRNNMAWITYDFGPIGPGQPDTPILKSLTLNGGYNDVTYNIDSGTDMWYTINETGYGKDTVNFAPASQFLHDLLGGYTVNGNHGYDALVLNDQNNPNNDVYSISATAIVESNSQGFGMFGYLYYSLMNTVAMNGGSGNVTYNVESTSGSVPTAYTINETGVGNDAVNFAPVSKVLNNLGGPVIINGNSGFDTLATFDQHDASAATYTITANTISRSNMATITYNYMNVVTINGGLGDVTFNVLSTPNTGYTTMTINEIGFGADTVNVGRGDLSQISGLTINGSDFGYDVINFNDGNFYDGYVVTDNELTDTQNNFAIYYNSQSVLDIWTNPSSLIFNNAVYTTVMENGVAVY
jgi:hypothetical protein